MRNFKFGSVHRGLVELPRVLLLVTCVLALCLAVHVVHCFRFVIVGEPNLHVPGLGLVCNCCGYTLFYMGKPVKVVVDLYGCSPCWKMLVVVHELVHAIYGIENETVTQFVALYIMYRYLGISGKVCALGIALQAYSDYLYDLYSTYLACVRFFDRGDWEDFNICINFWVWETEHVLNPYERANILFAEYVLFGRVPRWFDQWYDYYARWKLQLFLKYLHEAHVK